ncbi:phasin [Thalassobaculum fulvum]|jgi:phasin family protein|uniref:Phasin n=1 Tax=Thalassobaculum fulvum TaxID=1633335 RepID=A0A918XU56_9PROT|nr:phasin family protein [Thalassobaculum fulvum]GHD53998.1 phasin [Thalassobaculum fulvum]
MAEFKNPFMEIDVQKMMGEFRIPNVDVEAVVAAQKKNIEALTSANQLAVEGMQAVAKRQAEILRQTAEELQKNMQSLMENGAPDAKVAKSTELTKTAFEKAIANMKELSEMVSKSNAEAFDVINKRVAESLDEIRDLTKATKK